MIYLYIGIIIGSIIGVIISRWLGRIKTVGDIIVSKGEDKTIFSLELDDEPEILTREKKVAFNIVVPSESPRE